MHDKQYEELDVIREGVVAAIELGAWTALVVVVFFIGVGFGYVEWPGT